jgi:hypothetical protein
VRRAEEAADEQEIEPPASHPHGRRRG